MLFMLSRSAAQLSRSAAQLLSLSTVYVVVLLGAKAQEPPEPATAAYGAYGGYPGRWPFTRGNGHICPLCPAPATGLLQGLCCKGYAARAMLQPTL